MRTGAPVVQGLTGAAGAAGATGAAGGAGAALTGAQGSTWQHCLAPQEPPVHTAAGFLGALPAGQVKLAHVGGGGVVVTVDCGPAVVQGFKWQQTPSLHLPPAQTTLLPRFVLPFGQVKLAQVKAGVVVTVVARGFGVVVTVL